MSEELEQRLEAAKKEGKEVVAVLGLGFVGTAVLANLSRTLKEGAPAFFVVGVDRNDEVGREKCCKLNEGEPPVYASDPSLRRVISQAHCEHKNIAGTVDPKIMKYADVVVFCINLDLDREKGQTERLSMDIGGYEAAMEMVGSVIKPGTLVTVESTLPVGMCDKVLYPALCRGQAKQGIDTEENPPLLAFCYERVMPGPDYLDSVNNYWRAFAGINKESADRAEEFLSRFVNIAEYPLWRHKNTRAAEMAKLMENSYRAVNIAFIEEWADLAEATGVDLFDVIASIKVRKGTHDNMMLPGLGVGGYCLTKDALLAAFGAEEIIGVDAPLPFSRRAILTNENMPMKAFNWINCHFNGSLSGRSAALLGVTYRPGVADTRSSATEILARALFEGGMAVWAYDPLISKWDEFDEAELIAGKDWNIQPDAVVICLPDPAYRDILAANLSNLRQGSIVVDPWNMVGDKLAERLSDKGVTVKVYGRGDI
ncbi:MAG: nucleotide sugar dehydrogenase [Candidatus Dadabacteria bacterium]|nr:MAG: nucleotide sugar dehydrogenase [Candidatus Dadabacteria bacterium]